MPLDSSDRLLAGLGGDHLEPGEAQARREQLADVGLVVDDDEPSLRVGACLTSSSGPLRRPGPQLQRPQASMAAQTRQTPEHNLGTSWERA